MDFKEKELIKTLKMREVKPSKEVWEKLDKQLTQNKRRTPRYYYWGGIAAILVIIILLGSFYNSENKENEISVKEVNLLNEKENTIDKSEESPHIFNGWVETSNKKTIGDKKNSSSPEETSFTSPQIKNTEEKILTETEKVITSKENEHIAETSNENKSVNSEKEENSISVKNDLIDLKTEDSKLSLEDEVEWLLADALITTMEQEENSSDQSVDASYLLREVNQEIENEADRNLKEQMQQIMKDGWYKAKMAFASNN